MIISFTQRQEASNMMKGAFYFKYWVIVWMKHQIMFIFVSLFEFKQIPSMFQTLYKP